MNTTYAIDFPKGITIKDSQGNASCSVFCAAYWNVQIAGKTVPLMLLPATGQGSACAGGCGNGTDIQNATAWHSYLLLDVMTDPQLPTAANAARPAAGYADQHGSIADDCFGATNATGVVAGFTVAKAWSNATNSHCRTSTESATRISVHSCELWG